MTDELQEVFTAALAGLLHDVGKFSQRAGVQPDATSQAFTEKDYGRHGAHAKWSIAFIDAHVPEQWRSGLSPVLFHHNPQDRMSKVVALADRLSAAEREGSGDAAAKQLISIFCQIGEQPPPQMVWPLRDVRLSEDAIFPRQELPGADEKAAYRKLWQGFERAVDHLPGDDLPTYVEGMLYAMQRYAWSVPGAFYRSVPDVSLYDHSRTTAALAACLVGFDEPTLDALLSKKPPTDPVALLVGGDISGVQDFIYTITARGAARGLRGRSFYLQMLTEAVARFILRELDLPITNLIYSGGGHFYLLAPVAAADRLKQLRAAISRKLLTHHGGDLYLALGWSELTAGDFQREQFGQAWKAVGEKMNEAKRRRFSELEAKVLIENVFGPLGTGGEATGECQVCHFDGPVTEDVDSRGEKRRICALCKSLEELGSHLRDTRYLLLAEVPANDTRRGCYYDALESFGLALGLSDARGRAVLALPADVQRVTLLAMDDAGDAAREAARLSARAGYPVAGGVRYTVNVVPRTEKGDIATFDWLQAQSKGVHRLGVLRMDVDDLGELFLSGMKNEATLSRVAALSSALSLFFEGWLGKLCQMANEDQGRVYPIYSGGDDLFIVGAWDALPALASRIREDLARFAAGNPSVHISGGLTLHAGKYPLYQAAQDAEEALDEAKGFRRSGDERAKDAFNFLGLTIPWEKYDNLERERGALVALADANRAVLRTLLQLYARATHEGQKRGKAYWGPWMWHCAYRLKRMENRNRRSPELVAQIGRIRQSLSKNAFRYIEVLGPAARWAELLTRKEQENGNTK